MNLKKLLIPVVTVLSFTQSCANTEKKQTIESILVSSNLNSLAQNGVFINELNGNRVVYANHKVIEVNNSRVLYDSLGKVVEENGSRVLYDLNNRIIEAHGQRVIYH